VNTKVTKRQHYIPQFYLKGFSQDNSHIFLFDKLAPTDKQYRYQTTENIAFENHFYTYEAINHKKEDLEDIFMQIESQAAEIIRKIDNNYIIDEQDKADLSLFISFLWVRTPAYKKQSLGAQGKLAEKIMRMQLALTPKPIIKRFYNQQHGRDPTDAEINDYLDFAKNPNRSRLVVDFPQGYWIKQILDMALEICPLFQMMNWDIIHSNQKFSYITSDFPMLLIPPKVHNPHYGVGLVTLGSRKIIPLNSHLCLVLYDRCQNPIIRNRNLSDKNFMRFVNYNIARAAERFIFSPFREKLEVMFKKDKKAMLPRPITYSVN
jgi:hypothetical protein